MIPGLTPQEERAIIAQGLPTVPLDVTHTDSLAAVEQIRKRLETVLQDVARWEPRPCPSREVFK